MRLSYRVLVVTSVFMLLLPGCSRQADEGDAIDSPSSQAMEKVTFRLAWVPDMAEVGVFVAKEQGYFAREGLDVTIEPGGFGLDPIKLVASGSDDYGIGGAGNLLLARAQGVPVVAVGAEFQNTPVGFITHKESGITSFEQFRGKRVGIQTGADTDVLYRALLVKNAMTPGDLEETPIQFDMGPFVNDLIDVLPGYVTNQPIVLKGLGFETNVITAQSQGLNYYGNVFFTSEEKIRNQSDQVQRFVRAVRAGWQHAIDNKGDAISALMQYTKEFEAKNLDQIYDAVIPFIQPTEQGVPLLGMTRERWSATWKVLDDAGLIKDEVGVVELAHTNNFITD